MTDQTARIPSWDEIDGMAEGDPLKLRDLAWALARDLEAARRDLAANEGSEDARLAVAEEKVSRYELTLDAVADFAMENRYEGRPREVVLAQVAALARNPQNRGSRG